MSEFLLDIPAVGWSTIGWALAVFCFLLILRKCGGVW
jgi:hypothetical protein